MSTVSAAPLAMNLFPEHQKNCSSYTTALLLTHESGYSASGLLAREKPKQTWDSHLESKKFNQESLSIAQFYLISDHLMQTEQETKNHNTYKDNFLWDFWCLRLRKKKKHQVCKIFASLRWNHLLKQPGPNEELYARPHVMC